jgi:iron(III) transport system ATP-binding protein
MTVERVGIEVEIRRLSKTYSTARRRGAPATDREPGIHDVSLTVSAGEILSVLGPSGSGKSTLLKCLAGLEQPSTGELVVDGRTYFSSESKVWVPPQARNIGLVFQSLALWPHLSVYRNVAYPLEVAKVPRAEIRERVRKTLDLVGCVHLIDRLPNQISGGEQQRVAVARALVTSPPLVLFDEPFSSVDAGLRMTLRRWLLELREETRMTAVFVTHDQEEAMMLGDRVAVIFDGQLESVDLPQRTYTRPRTLRLARFVGRMNLLPGVVETAAGDNGRGPTVKTAAGTIVTSRESLADGAAYDKGGPVLLGIRPTLVGIDVDSLADGTAPPVAENDENRLDGRVTFAKYCGQTTHVEVEVTGGVQLELVTWSQGALPKIGEPATVTLPARHLRVFDGEPEPKA